MQDDPRQAKPKQGSNLDAGLRGEAARDPFSGEISQLAMRFA